MPQELSAQVALHQAGDARLAEVVKAFADAGFDIGPVVALNFSIAGPVALFESYFGVPLNDLATSGRASLPIDAVDPAVRPLVKAIVFTTGYEPFR